MRWLKAPPISTTRILASVRTFPAHPPLLMRKVRHTETSWHGLAQAGQREALQHWPLTPTISSKATISSSQTLVSRLTSTPSTKVSSSQRHPQTIGLLQRTCSRRALQTISYLSARQTILLRV